jgi:hypothetical protein
MIQTLAFNARLPVLLGASPFYRTPASPIARGLELNESDYVRARLTAMAVETDGFQREDLYTLFVTTRIINFLKGLPLVASANLVDLLNQPWHDPRTRIGCELPRFLAENEKLYFWRREGLAENQKFKADMFVEVLSQIAQIACINGKQIVVTEFSRSAASRQPDPFRSRSLGRSAETNAIRF